MASAQWEGGNKSRAQWSDAQNKMGSSNPVLGTVRSAVEGMTLNWGDEIGTGLAAAAATLGDENPSFSRMGEIYRDMKQSYDRQQGQFQQEHPYISMGANIAGGLATSGLGAAKTMALQGGKRVAALAGGGTALGAVSGAGAAKPGETLEQALTGGTIGLGLGLAFPAAGYLTSKAVKKLISKQPLTAVDRKILQAIKADEMTPQDVRDALAEMGDGTIADAAGENMINLVRTARGVPGPAANKAEKFFQDRMRGEFTRIMDAFKTGLGKGNTYSKTIKQLEESRKIAAAPIYRRAYEIDINITPELKQIFERPNVKLALSRSLKKARNEGVTLADDVIDMRRLDYTKRAIDDMMDKVRRGGDEFRVLQKTKQEILKIIDTQNPLYKEARSVWSGSKQLQDAVEDGAKFLRGDSDLIAEDIANLSDAQREFFRVGAIRALRGFMSRTKDTNSLAAKFDNPAMRERLKAIFPDEDSFEGIMRILAKEERFGEVRNKILRGSQTHEKQSMGKDFGLVPGAAVDLAQGNTGTAVGRFAHGMVDKFTRPSPKMAGDVLDRTVNPRLGQNLQYLQGLRSPVQINPKWRKLVDALQGAATIQGGTL